MYKRMLMLTQVFLLISQLVFAQNKVKIIKVTGDVKIRRGLDEEWQAAKPNMLLEEIDSILTGEGGEVKLQLIDGSFFKLENNSIVDINDLRKITDKELFLFIMSNKIRNIDIDQQKTPLRIGNVSVVHGESKVKSGNSNIVDTKQTLFIQEKNGAKAIYYHNYYPNAIIKLHKIIAKYTPLSDCGEVYFYLGKSFEAIQKNGQAIDAYRKVIDLANEQDCNDPHAQTWANKAEKGINRLK